MKLWDLRQRGGDLQQQGRVVIGLARRSYDEDSQLIGVQGADVVGDFVGHTSAVFSIAVDWFHEYGMGGTSSINSSMAQ
jgi:hypothetical protein